MRRNALIGVCLAVALGIVGCQDQKTEPSAPTGPAELGQSNVQAKLLRAPAKAVAVDEHLSDAAGRAINPSDYVCGNEVSAVSDWLDGEIGRTDINNLIDLINNWAADQVTFADGEYFLTTATPQFFGYTGEFTQTMLKTEKDVKRFWDIPSANIQMVAAHGTMLQSVDRVANTYENLFTYDGVTPITHSDAVLFAGIVHDEVLADPALAGGNHPIFSFNAVAFPGDPDFNAPPKVVMGDGVLEGFNAVGLGDVAPQGVFAHEFAHHIQFANGYFAELPPNNDPNHSFSRAERTRYTELMADAYAGYYLTHARGAALRQKRVEQFLQVYFQLGDCGFTSSGHHGTPNQRMASARFGFKVAADAQKQGIILSSAAFHTLFRAAYTQITAPDAI